MTEASNSLPIDIGERLLPDERLIWWGRPGQGLVLTPRDGILIPFSLFWGGFSIFWEATALQSKAPFPFALFGLPFVAVGLFLIFGRFIVDAWLRGRIIYALSDRRVLIAREGPWPSFQSFNRDRFADVTLIEGTGGRGTIRFSQATSVFGYGGRVSGGWIPALDPTPQFLQIADVRRVFAAVQA